LEERLRQRRTVDRDQHAVAAAAVMMDELRDQLLPGAALPRDEDRRVRGRDLARQLDGLPERRRVAENDDLVAMALEVFLVLPSAVRGPRGHDHMRAAAHAALAARRRERRRPAL